MELGLVGKSMIAGASGCAGIVIASILLTLAAIAAVSFLATL